MRSVWILVLLIGCGPGLKQAGDSTSAGGIDPGAGAAQAFVDAVTSQDVAAVQAMLQAPLTYAGLLFPDPGCAQQFPAAATLAGAQLPAFAACLAKLPLRVSRRRDPMFGVAIFEYPPGIEVAARFAFANGTTGLRWIGYAGARDRRDPLLSLTPMALAALRTDTSDSALAPDHARALEAELAQRDGKATYAWLKVCFDGTGATTSVHAVEASSPRAAQAFTEVIRTWKFKSFMAGTQPVPACSLVLLEHPGDTVRAIELLPYPLPSEDVALRVSAEDLELASGERQIEPDDPDKLEIQDLGNPSLAGSYWHCLDETGKVTRVDAIEPTGIAGYDAKIRTVMATWRYRPFVASGAPHKVCAAVTFLYRQR